MSKVAYIDDTPYESFDITFEDLCFNFNKDGTIDVTAGDEDRTYELALNKEENQNLLKALLRHNNWEES